MLHLLNSYWCLRTPPDPLTLFTLATLTFHQLYSRLGSCLIFVYRAPYWRKPVTCKHFFKKTNLFKEWMKKFVALPAKEKRPKMNGKMTLTFFQLYTLYKKLGQFFFHTLLSNMFKQRCISFVLSYKYLNKLVSEV